MQPPEQGLDGPGVSGAVSHVRGEVERGGFDAAVSGRGRQTMSGGWLGLERDIRECERCPRLRTHCRRVAEIKRRAYRDSPYWGKPVPGFGDTRARLLVLGLAPAAHGANRTGRMFTGDRSGDWLFGALHRAGVASRPTSVGRGDGMKLRSTFISAACRCAPPGNRPTAPELASCAGYLDREFELLERLRVVVALGGVAWDAVLRRARRLDPSSVPRPRPRFGHGARTRLVLGARRAALDVVGSYHPSRQNTQTGRLTRRMFESVMRGAIRRAGIAARGR